LVLLIATALARDAHAQAADVFDDFTGPALNTTLWTYTNPLNDAPLTMTGTQVQIAVPGNRNHFTWGATNTAPRIMQTAANTDFEIDVKFDSAVSLNYQMLGVRIEQNGGNAVLLQLGHNGTTPEVAHGQVINNTSTNPVATPIPAGTPTYLRVRRRGTRYSFSYSFNGDGWFDVGSVDRVMTVTRIGVFVGNYSTGTPPAHTGLIDYFYKRSLPPAIATQPSSLTVNEPSAATFSVVASGTVPLTYQWRRNGADISGATSSSYTLNPSAYADNGAQFDVVVSNDRGSLTSNVATLTVIPQIITTPPVAVDDTYAVSSGGTINTSGAGLPGVLANDSDADLDPLTAVLVSNVVNGTLTLNPDGSFNYVHSGNDLVTRELTPGASNSALEFGVSTAIDEDTLVIGSNSSENGRAFAGAAYVYVRNGAAWALQAKIVPDDAVSNHYFGWAVDVSGDTLVIGAPGDSFAGKFSGAAYVYVRNGTTWTRQAKLTPSISRARDEFGTSVSIDNDTVVVGTNYHDDGTTDRGAAFVFTRTGTTWTEQARLLASDPSTGAWFGLSVAVHHDRVVVGAINDDTMGTNAGAAYIFERSGGVWTQQAKLVASDGAAGNTFGFSVAIHEDRVVVGANNYTMDHTNATPGAAYVFDWDGFGWVATQTLTSPVPPESGFHGFGVSVALRGDTILVGTNGDDQAGTDAGAAYVFQRSGMTWTMERTIVSPSAAAEGEFGVAVALGSDHAVVAANRHKFRMVTDNTAGSAAVVQLRGLVTDSFTYVANDIATSSNTATVTITIAQP
jgi:hypothetical protein